MMERQESLQYITDNPTAEDISATRKALKLLKRLEAIEKTKNNISSELKQFSDKIVDYTKNSSSSSLQYFNNRKKN
jgi:hypothetical protein